MTSTSGGVASLRVGIKIPQLLATSAFGLAPYVAWSYSTPVATSNKPNPIINLNPGHMSTSSDHNIGRVEETVDMFNLTFLIQLWIACNHCVVWAILELYFRRLGLHINGVVCSKPTWVYTSQEWNTSPPRLCKSSALLCPYTVYKTSPYKRIRSSAPLNEAKQGLAWYGESATLPNAGSSVGLK